MISFPNAKINIGLNVVSKRADGYHNLETIFYPVQLADGLEISDAQKATLTTSGIQIDGNTNDNLILKAYQLLQNEYKLPPVAFHLHKIVPFGAGLGGGSSDAAFTIKMLNEYFNLSLSVSQQENYAAKIGADCPFFIQNKPVFATGIGNEFHQLQLDLSSFEIVILKPPISVGTKEAYRNIIPKKPEIPLIHAIQKPIETWRNSIENDFEKSVFTLYPEIAELKKILYQTGAVYASMSGSGSAVYGIFPHLPAHFADNIPEGIFIYR